MVHYIQVGFLIKEHSFRAVQLFPRHQIENPKVNLNILNDTEYNSLTEVISKLEREEKIVMMSVDERETFFKNEIDYSYTRKCIHLMLHMLRNCIMQITFWR